MMLNVVESASRSFVCVLKVYTWTGETFSELMNSAMLMHGTVLACFGCRKPTLGSLGHSNKIWGLNDLRNRAAT